MLSITLGQHSLSYLECLGQRFGVHHRPSGNVDQDRSFLHLGQLPLPDESGRLLLGHAHMTSKREGGGGVSQILTKGREVA